MRKKENTVPGAMREAGFFSHELELELIQARDEGLDLREYENLIRAVAALQPGEVKEKFSDTIYDVILSAKKIRGYAFQEPSDLAEIMFLCEKGAADRMPDSTLTDRVRGAWYGRIAGCLLGKPLEGIKTDELVPLLRETGNYPLSRYPLNAEMTDEIVKKYRFNLRGKCFADTLACAPADDDTNYTVMAQMITEKYGSAFTAENVIDSWVALQPRNAYFTAERVAFLNYLRGYRPPATASYQNHYREWIGAQIRADYYGYINPGRPDLAAEMAWRDASVSHVKNGIYGAMFVAAMLAVAAVSDDVTEVVRGGMRYIPKTSRLYDRLSSVVNDYAAGVPAQDVFARIHREFDEHTGYGWCHVISNAMVVTASLIYGGADFGKSICMAVQTGFDTDCNGATVGSVLGMLLGCDGVGEVWTKPLRGTLDTTIVGVGKVRIDTLAEKTISFIRQLHEQP